MVGKRCKRMASALIALVCVLALSVQAFANANSFSYVTYSSSGISSLSNSSFSSGTLTIDVVFEGAPGDSQQVRDAWHTVMGDWLHDDNYSVFFEFSSSYFYVYAFPRDSVVFGATYFYSRFGYRFHFQSLNGKVIIREFKSSNDEVQISIYSNSSKFFYKNIVPVISDSSFSGTGYKVLSDVDTLIIQDDITPDEPEPEPEPPTSSSEPDPPVEPSLPDDPPADPYNPAGPPSIGSVDSEYLPYDTEVWDAVMWYLRDAIGSAGRVIFLVIAVATVLPVVLSVLRHYIGDRNDHGGGLL